MKALFKLLYSVIKHMWWFSIQLGHIRELAINIVLRKYFISFNLISHCPHSGIFCISNYSHNKRNANSTLILSSYTVSNLHYLVPIVKHLLFNFDFIHRLIQPFVSWRNIKVNSFLPPSIYLVFYFVGRWKTANSKIILLAVDLWL